MKIQVEDILEDLRAGLRTKAFLEKYGLSLAQFEQLLKQLIRDGLFTRQEFKAWKAHRPVGAFSPEDTIDALDPVFDESEPAPRNIETYVITEPEMNQSWALELFSTPRDRMKGAKFKANLQGKKYSFVVEDMIFRGAVKMHKDDAARASDLQAKREEAIAYITKHGWAAYLENRAFLANFGNEEVDPSRKARLVLIHCRNQTFLAALHTPHPTINLYVASSLDKLRDRLSRSIETRGLDLS